MRLILIGLAVCFYTTAAFSQENRRPIAHAGPDETVAEGALVTLDGSGSSDPEGEALEGPDPAVQGFTAPEQLVDDKVLVFTLRVTDASGNVSEAEVRITVTADNEAPVVVAGDDRTSHRHPDIYTDETRGRAIPPARAIAHGRVPAIMVLPPANRTGPVKPDTLIDAAICRT